MNEKEIKEKLRTYISKEILNNPKNELSFDEKLITSGLMDSFSLAQIGVFIEIEFNTYIPDPELTVDNMNTIDDMAIKIMEKMK